MVVVVDPNRATPLIFTAYCQTSENVPTVTQADTQEMPNVDDYIAQKAAVYRLQQDMTNWERKVRPILLGHNYLKSFLSSPHVLR